MVVGTSIGAGMLAMPVATASLGFPGAIVFLVLTWALMTYTGLLMLEVNLWLPSGTNLISMSKATLGPIGELLAWLCYLLLLYCLLAAYTAGGSDVLHEFLSNDHLHLAPWMSSLLVVVLVAWVVFNGIGWVDFVNRYLMAIKIVSFGLLVVWVGPYIQAHRLFNMQLTLPIATLIIMVTSFGFSTIVPSLRGYFQDNVGVLRKVILIGSLIPLVCYGLWMWAIHGLLPSSGPNSLTAMVGQGETTLRLVAAVSNQTQSPLLTVFTNIFTSFSVMTSFLCVSLSLSDFLADGLNRP
jgi:tyrosine-specific transport protein